MTYTIYVCPECEAVFTEPYQSHGKRGDYPAGRRPECVGALEPVEVVPRAVADELFAVAQTVAPIVREAGESGLDFALAKYQALTYREAVGSG